MKKSFQRNTVIGGRVVRRSRPMSESGAKAFERLAKGCANFLGAEVGRLAPNSQQYVVTYMPASTESQDKVFKSVQGQREKRAARQEKDYRVSLDGPPALERVMLLREGEITKVDLGRGVCSCADFRYRLQGSGVKCKHMVIAESYLRDWQEAGA